MLWWLRLPPAVFSVNCRCRVSATAALGGTLSKVAVAAVNLIHSMLWTAA